MDSHHVCSFIIDPEVQVLWSSKRLIGAYGYNSSLDVIHMIASVWNDYEFLCSHKAFASVLKVNSSSSTLMRFPRLQNAPISFDCSHAAAGIGLLFCGLPLLVADVLLCHHKESLHNWIKVLFSDASEIGLL